MTMSKTQNQSVKTRAAEFNPSSWDEEKRSFQVAFATETPVKRRDRKGVYNEVLSLEGLRSVDTVPVLDTHSRGSLNNLLGSASEIKIENGEARANVRLSQAGDVAERVAVDLTDGIKPGVSCGYVIHKWGEAVKNGIRTLTAIDWELLEISLVPIPADAATGLRSKERDVKMDNEINRADLNRSIRAIADKAGLGRAWADEKIDGEFSLEEVREMAFEDMKTRGADRRVSSIGHSDATLDNPQVRASAMADALYSRIAGTEPSEIGKNYAGLSIVDMARECVRVGGQSVIGITGERALERALHTTSDFPLLLTETTNRTLRDAYKNAPGGIRLAGRKKTATDFRPLSRVQLSGAPELEKVNEHGEFKSGTMSVAKETYKLETYGRIIGFTRQALVNDDLGAFADVTARMGREAANFENKYLASLLAANDVMDDGKPVFGVDHKNVAGTGTEVTVDALAAARLAIREVKGLNGEHISATPKYLICGPLSETAAEKALASLYATKEVDVNPFSNRLQLIVDARLGKEWYVVAGDVDGLEYCYLSGQEGPQIDSKVGFEIDGVQFKVRLDFAAAFVDYRGWYRNAGKP
jgi:hypothetical protein